MSFDASNTRPVRVVSLRAVEAISSVVSKSMKGAK